MTARLTIIIPAHNEAGYIGDCLSSLLDQDDTAGAMHIVVAANACTDATVEISNSFAARFDARGAKLTVLDLPTPGKIAALNSAEDHCAEGPRIYLDADVRCDPALIGQICTVLGTEQPQYATGTLAVAPARSVVTRAYSRFWQRLPFVQSGAVGAGLFAVNATGRARWDTFPQIISDDTFVRLNFAPSERTEVPARYHWPMIEGFSALVRVRRRQDAGVDEVRQLYPELMANDRTPSLSKGDVVKLALSDPWGFAVYATVTLAVKFGRPSKDWVRGR